MINLHVLDWVIESFVRSNAPPVCDIHTFAHRLSDMYTFIDRGIIQYYSIYSTTGSTRGSSIHHRHGMYIVPQAAQAAALYTPVYSIYRTTGSTRGSSIHHRYNYIPQVYNV
jgi:hypothetical protein